MKAERRGVGMPTRHRTRPRSGARVNRRHHRCRLDGSRASNVALEKPAFTRGRMREEMISWIAREGCSHALTLATNRSLTVEKISAMFGKFCLDLDRACLGRKNVTGAPSGDRVFAVAFVEHPDTNIHLHVAMRLDGWWPDQSQADAGDTIEVIWKRITGGAGSTQLDPIEDAGWGRYMTKKAAIVSGDYLLSRYYHPHR